MWWSGCECGLVVGGTEVAEAAVQSVQGVPALDDPVAQLISCREVKGCEMRDAGLCERVPAPPGVESDQVDGSGGEDVCESRLRQVVYRVRRAPVVATAWWMVPSTPARVA